MYSVTYCQQLYLAQSRMLCLTGCLKYDSRVKRMIKLLIVSWVQVFITFMLAYFWAAYSIMISIMLIPFI